MKSLRTKVATFFCRGTASSDRDHARLGGVESVGPVDLDGDPGRSAQEAVGLGGVNGAGPLVHRGHVPEVLEEFTDGTEDSLLEGTATGRCHLDPAFASVWKRPMCGGASRARGRISEGGDQLMSRGLELRLFRAAALSWMMFFLAALSSASSRSAWRPSPRRRSRSEDVLDGGAHGAPHGLVRMRRSSSVFMRFLAASCSACRSLFEARALGCARLGGREGRFARGRRGFDPLVLGTRGP